jgi:hypothetical protein
MTGMTADESKVHKINNSVSFRVTNKYKESFVEARLPRTAPSVVDAGMSLNYTNYRL